MENLEISSGKLLIIDQFMLANEQFIKPIVGSSEHILSQALKFGGELEELKPGQYFVLRDPARKMILLTQDKNEPDELFEKALGQLEKINPEKKVFVDTRCLVFCDANIVNNSDLIEKYSSLRKKGKEKPARDLLRQSGAAVRYGFNSHGDELAVANLGDAIVLWPDVV